MLTVEQAADRLGTTVRFVRRLRAERRIAVVKLGKHVRIDSADLDAYIAAGRQARFLSRGTALTVRQVNRGRPDFLKPRWRSVGGAQSCAGPRCRTGHPPVMVLSIP